MSLTANLTPNLSSEQAAVVAHRHGPALVMAGAGSGKTATMAALVASLIADGFDPRRILAVTFTNKGARELKSRVELRAGPAGSSCVVGTFHALSARHLRRFDGRAVISDEPRIVLPPGWSVIDEDDCKRIGKNLVTAAGGDKADAAKAIELIVAARDRGMSAEQYIDANIIRYGRVIESLAVQIEPHYLTALGQHKATDFPGLILAWRAWCRADPSLAASLYDAVIVDEYQDTSPIQDEIAWSLAAQCGRLIAVGDPRQAIYGWRSATVDLIRTFARRRGAVVYPLSTNYRSTPEILTAANHLVSKAKEASVDGPALSAFRAGGRSVVKYVAIDEYDEAERVAACAKRFYRDGMPYRDQAVLYRTNAQSRALEHCLARHGVPYQLVGGLTFWERTEVRDCLAYLRLCHNPSDDLAFRRIVNVPRRGLGDAAIDKLEETRRTLGLDSLWSAAKTAPLRGAAGKALAGFLACFEGLAVSSENMSATLRELVTRSGYLAHAAKDEDSGQDRVENVDELLTVAGDFPDVGSLLEHAVLEAGEDQERKDNPTGESVITLCTIHAAKGREWRVVYAVGWEEGVLPSPRGDLEEERRLGYVALTRAMDRLFVGGCRTRRKRPAGPSRFLVEAELLAEDWTV